MCNFDSDKENEIIKKLMLVSLKITGNLIKSIGKGQSFEVEILNIEVLGESDPEKYPIQPKKHSF
ncbi:MAG: hypothetical protein CM15mP102_00040 [Flavobacteriales bacterium]|nr:MAG: hypothetical protein CM15mP102_00040 [Flavobacteriales bacterium]